MPYTSTHDHEVHGPIAVLIPAWQPEIVLAELVTSLRDCGLDLIVVIDDGSGSKSQPVFEELRRSGIEVIRHAVNLGKGRALKTGFNYLVTKYPHLRGVVTADADGQHRAADIAEVARNLLVNGGCAVLGVRTFGRDVPARSRFGNLLTRSLFGIVTGTRLNDTQTGLRGLPVELLPELMKLDGERYEYEMTMLAHICGCGRKPNEVPIETVYIDNNRSSHFDPVWDSMRIYLVLARFYLSSIVASAVDLAGFSAAFALTGSLFVSVAAGRLSSVVNYALNRRFVFHARSKLPDSLWRYYLLVIVVGLCSYGSILMLTTYARWNVFATKITVDIVFSILSFWGQRAFVFNAGRDRERHAIAGRLM